MSAENREVTRSELERKLSELNAEIGSYPGPITGCDAQFNHLLEERARLNSELTQLEALMEKQQK